MIAEDNFTNNQANDFISKQEELSHSGNVLKLKYEKKLPGVMDNSNKDYEVFNSSTASLDNVTTSSSTPSSSSESSTDNDVKLEETNGQLSNSHTNGSHGFVESLNEESKLTDTSIASDTESKHSITTENALGANGIMIKTSSTSNGENGIAISDHTANAEPASEEVSDEKSQNPPKKKQKRTSSQLSRLLECADWYVTSLAGSGGRVRQSALKFENMKEEVRENIASEPKEEKTPEELEAIAARKRATIEKRRLKLKEKELEKQRKREELEKRKKIREEMIKEGKVQEKEKQAVSSSLTELLEGASYFASVITKHNNSEEVTIGQAEREGLLLRKTIKKVERYAPEFAHKEKKKWPKMKEMFKSKIPSESKPKAPKVKKVTKAKKVSKPRGRKRATASTPEPQVKQEEEGEEEEGEEEQEEEPEVEEEEERWFLNLRESEDLPLLDGQKFFREEVFNSQEIELSPEEGIVTAEQIVKGNLGNYQLDHPNFKPTEIEIVFPLSNYKEKYYLCLPSKSDVYNPFDDIGRTMELIALVYLPEEHQAKVFDFENPMDCIIGKYIQAFTDENYDTLIESIKEFNQLISSLKEDPTKPIYKHCAARQEIPSAVVYELLNQCYSRTVLPNSRQLKSYKAFSNYVYGELMPSFLTLLYKQCNLNPTSKFIDLGSGVGNCSIQSALQFGCESYGVEIMEHASNLADLQLIDFQNRCKAYGFQTGYVKLFGRQSFIDNPEVKEVVDKCDVILCNNYLFDAKLNKKVNDQLFSNLKTGTKIISLKPIVPPGHTISWDNIDSILNRIKTTRFIYGNNSVSWTSNGGYYYVSEVMNDIVDENFVVFQSRSKRGNYTIDESSRERTPLNAFTHNV